MKLALALAALALAAACAPRTEAVEPRPIELDGELDAPGADPEVAPAPVAARTGELSREALTEVLDAGPGVFLSTVEVQPRFDEQRFAGWEIVRFRPPERYAAVDLRPGDVVRSVNGHTVSRPEQLQEVWEKLRAADLLVIEVTRDGAPFELRFDIRP